MRGSEFGEMVECQEFKGSIVRNFTIEFHKLAIFQEIPFFFSFPFHPLI